MPQMMGERDGLLDYNNSMSQSRELPERRSRLPLRYILLFSQGVMMLCMGLIGLYNFRLATWFSWHSFPPAWAGYTAYQFIGFFAFVIFGPFGLLFLIILSQQMSHPQSTAPKSLRLLYLLVMTGGCGVATYMAEDWGNALLRCGVVGCYGDPKDYPPPTNKNVSEGFLAGLGLGMMMIMGMVTLLHFCIFFRTLFLPESLSIVAMPGKGDKSPLLQSRPTDAVIQPHKIWTGMRVLGVMAVLGVFGFFFFITSYMPNSWEYFTPSQMAKYNNHTMRWDTFNCSGTYWYNVSCPELGYADWKSVEVKLNNAGWKMWIFVDVMIFYGGLLLFAIVCVLMRVSTSVERFIATPFLLPVVGLVSVGTLMGWLAILLIHLSWIYYWAWNHNYNSSWPTQIHIPGWENLARTSGQVGVLQLSLLLLPITRNSVLPTLMGVSWESTVYAHRILGYSMLVTILVHLAAWIKIYVDKDVFPHDLYALPSWKTEQIDNFTVPLAFYSSLFCFIGMGLFSLWPIRRKFFEIFFWLHHIGFMLIIPVTLWHAAAGWFFVTPPLVLWCFDRALRFWYSSYAIAVQDVTTVGDVVQIFISRDSSVGRKFTTLAAGQYVFVNVPEVSVFEWHPFTVSSSPTDPYVSLHIKRMGRGKTGRKNSEQGSVRAKGESWTSRLWKVVHHFESSTDDQPPLICVDGPYGEPIDYSQYDRVVLISGGIGITPCHSIFKYLYDIARYAGPDDVPGSVVLMWTAPKRDSFSIFAPTMRMGVQDDLGGRFQLLLHATREKGNSTYDEEDDGRGSWPTAELPWIPGRPDVVQLMASNAPAEGERALVFMCGPPPLIESAIAEAVKYPYEIHVETFEL